MRYCPTGGCWPAAGCAGELVEVGQARADADAARHGDQVDDAFVEPPMRQRGDDALRNGAAS
jgi:hypothetical protein